MTYIKKILLFTIPILLIQDCLIIAAPLKTKPMIGIEQRVIDIDPKVIATPTQPIVEPVKETSIVSAKSFSEQQKKNEDKKIKPTKYRLQIVDGKVCVWGKAPEDAYNTATVQVFKYVDKRTYQLKDTTFLADGTKCICLLRYMYKVSIPETWCLDTDMVTGFGKTKEKAFAMAYMEATTRAKRYQNNDSWKPTKSFQGEATNDSGIIMYDFTFGNIGKEHYCKIFFRFFMPRSK